MAKQATASVDFSKYLGVQVDTIEAPRAAPEGHYLGTFVKWAPAERNYNKATGGPPTPVIELTLKCTATLDDAIEADSTAAEKAIGRLFTKDYALDDDAGLYAIRRFASEACGVDTTGLSIADGLDAAKGSDVKFFNKPRPGKEEGVFYNNVTSIFAPDA